MRVGLLLFLTLLVAIRNSKQNPVPPTIVKDGENAYTSLTYKLNTPINKLNFNGQVKLPNFSTLHSNFFSSSHSSDLLKSSLTNNLETLKSEQGGIRGEGQISKSKEIYPKKDKKWLRRWITFMKLQAFR
ncbi:hypothetical protein PPACK8108_LOCUS17144 [Phakopsora pachyrhizi]|uniref:Secreted protein n=1 Tax=Phakopsora pachyrhizi TaxID=170000 RepID=A0AAV0BBH6_PHAPC|nr:hypothetical protein PPACK8108_LOCUS17144 [Phakopsora pachyrhizi]